MHRPILVLVPLLCLTVTPVTALAFDPDTSLADADGSWWGEAAEDHAGLTVVMVGDHDGDGYDDLLVAAPGSDVAAVSGGHVYLLLGGAGLAMDLSLAAADASFLGEAGDNVAGQSMARGGDLDGDGYADLLIGALSNGPYLDAGQAYIVFGGPTPYGMHTDLASVDASFQGEADQDEASTGLAGGGDVDGDGYDDLVVGAPGSDEPGGNAGQAYLVLGGTGGWAMQTSLADADASFWGEHSGDAAGRAVAVLGDVDGDGYDDLAVGAPDNDDGGTEAGQVYLVLGGATGWSMDISLSMADASYWGAATGDNAGSALAGAGDVDGDGYADLLIGAHRSDAAGADAGQVYLVLGRAAGWYADVHLSLADASFLGENAGVQAGSALAGVGDVDGDGYDDMLIGAPYDHEAGVDDAGQAYLLRGGEGPWSMATSLADADASFWGETLWSRAGDSVSGGGDLDGDGLHDMVIGAPYSAEAAVAAGQAYVVLGQPLPCSDLDGDGYGDPGTPDCSGGPELDCDDTDPAVNPAAYDDPCDDVDLDCNGIEAETTDLDGDGWSTCDGDCDDTDPTTRPNAPEQCDAIDNDCDGVLPTDEIDADGDGEFVCQGDCDDTDPAVHTGATEVCDGLDNDCDGLTLTGESDDLDGDGYLACADCDDTDPTLSGADLDADGWTTCDGDCNDLNPLISPDDADGDGYSICDGDCDDTDADLDLADADMDGYSTCDDDCDDIYVFMSTVDVDVDG